MLRELNPRMRKSETSEYFMAFFTEKGSKQFFNNPPIRANAQGSGLLARDADRMMDGGGQIGGGDGAVVRSFGPAIALADDPAAANAASRDQGAVDMLPVIAAGLVVDPRRSAELA